jgi:hypothetical protein
LSKTLLGPFDLLVWLIGFLAEVFVVAWALRDRTLLRHRTLLLYVSALAVDEILSFSILHRFGFSSNEYVYYYYYSDALLTLLMFVAIAGLCSRIFDEQQRGWRVRAVMVLIVGVTVLYATAVTAVKHQLLATRFAVEFSGSLYFTGMILTYGVWVLLLKRRDPRLRLVLVVSAFGIYFGGQTVTYVLRSVYPALTALHYLPPLMGAWLPVSLAYTFSKVPDEACIPLESLAGVG